jgi:UDP-2-acetamido-3-amino-2,3-dideoxy-glucuronate N-acetyltransferase
MCSSTYADVVHLGSAIDSRGSLFIAEHPIGLPFTPQRLFIVADVPAGESRGNHAHRTCHQFLICTSGTVDVVITYPDGRPDETHTLDAPNRGVHIRPLTWSSQHYRTHDAVLIVLASEAYDANEYINDANEYRVLAGVATAQPSQ